MIGQGNTAQIYEYGSDKIVKLYKNGISNEVCEKEFYITQNVNLAFGICPKAYETIHSDDRNGIIFEKIKGTTMLHEMLSKVWTIKKQSKALAKYHIAIQRKVNFQLPSVKNKLIQDIKAAEELTMIEKDRLYLYINQLPDGDTLCHFDFHPGNIIMNAEKPIVIDWMTACVGDGVADVARTCLMLKHGELATKSQFLKMLISKFQNIVLKNYLSEYLRISDVTLKDIQKWEIPVAAARLREWITDDEKSKLLKLVRKYIDNTKEPR